MPPTTTCYLKQWKSSWKSQLFFKRPLKKSNSISMLLLYFKDLTTALLMNRRPLQTGKNRWSLKGFDFGFNGKTSSLIHVCVCQIVHKCRHILLIRITAEDYLKWSGKTSPLLVRVVMTLSQRRGLCRWQRHAGGGITSFDYSSLTSRYVMIHLLYSVWHCTHIFCILLQNTGAKIASLNQLPLHKNWP